MIVYGNKLFNNIHTYHIEIYVRMHFYHTINTYYLKNN